MKTRTKLALALGGILASAAVVSGVAVSKTDGCSVEIVCPNNSGKASCDAQGAAAKCERDGDVLRCSDAEGSSESRCNG